MKEGQIQTLFLLLLIATSFSAKAVVNKLQPTIAKVYQGFAGCFLIRRVGIDEIFAFNYAYEQLN